MQVGGFLLQYRTEGNVRLVSGGQVGEDTGWFCSLHWMFLFWLFPLQLFWGVDVM